MIFRVPTSLLLIVLDRLLKLVALILETRRVFIHSHRDRVAIVAQ
jgi:hypothetical protein